MSNTWFQFKQFKINQGNCAMKVTTDACIQGAWTPLLPSVVNVLDIGTGTGLLSLMLAQRNPNINIDAIELDPAAAAQASQNFSECMWTHRIHPVLTDIRLYIPPYSYDLIICNPPFFAQSLLGPTHSKNMARHDVALTSQQLLITALSMLAFNGRISLLLPYTEYLIWNKIAAQCGLYEVECLHIRHRPSAPIKRVVTVLSLAPVTSPCITELIIQNATGEYTEHFKELLADFYFNL
jgi:tRNA1Val (adenine37-N6)-methyltransferase